VTVDPAVTSGSTGRGADEGAPSAPGPDRPRGGALVLAISLAVVFAGLAAVLAVVLAGRGGEDEEAAELRAAAGRFGEALVTYDHRDPDAHRDAVLGFATGSFREEYEDAFDQGLGEVIAEVEATSVGHVKDIYLSAIDAEQAQAIVVVDIEHSGAGGSSTLYDVYFRLTLVEVGGEWKVDQVTDLNFDTGGGAGATTPPIAPTGSTTTSVP
jgi:Mce-associated membrane protein